MPQWDTVRTHNSHIFVKPTLCDYFVKCDYLGDVWLFWEMEDFAPFPSQICHTFVRAKPLAQKGLTILVSVTIFGVTIMSGDSIWFIHIYE